MGENIDIQLNGIFSIGKYSNLGSNVKMRANNVAIGEYFYHSSGLIVGGGGADYPNANLTIGDRCVFHNNFLNVCEPIEIGDDVGLSPEVSIITHGFWWSVFEGHPATFKGVKIGDRTIVGYRTTILMGANIGEEVVIGANSVVSKQLDPRSIYAGNPIVKIRDIVPPDEKKRMEWFHTILIRYSELINFHKRNPQIKSDYPMITINKCTFNLETFEIDGPEDEDTDHFRDYIRKYGFRFYTLRPFKSVIKKDRR